MATNWRSTLGGACSAAGTSLMGIGVMNEFTGSDSKVIRAITLAGFILTAVGQFFGHLFAADAKQVANLADVVNANADAIRTGNTEHLTRADTVPPK